VTGDGPFSYAASLGVSVPPPLVSSPPIHNVSFHRQLLSWQIIDSLPLHTVLEKPLPDRLILVIIGLIIIIIVIKHLG